MHAVSILTNICAILVLTKVLVAAVCGALSII